MITGKILADMGARSVEQSRALIAQQKAQAEQAKIARLQQQQAAKQAQLQQAELRKARERERQRIYAAWQASYQEPPECSHYESDEEMVWCVNHKKKSRDEFFRRHGKLEAGDVSAVAK
mgnify:CR=1 FL=1